jgi:hypothetical protein
VKRKLIYIAVLAACRQIGAEWRARQKGQRNG